MPDPTPAPATDATPALVKPAPTDLPAAPAPKVDPVAPAPKPEPAPIPLVVETPDPEGLQTVEVLAAEDKTPAWLFAAAKQKHNWPVGAELTADDYAAAIQAAGDEVIG